jgi:hypothetical protein
MKPLPFVCNAQFEEIDTIFVLTNSSEPREVKQLGCILFYFLIFHACQSKHFIYPIDWACAFMYLFIFKFSMHMPNQ